MPWFERNPMRFFGSVAFFLSGAVHDSRCVISEVTSRAAATRASTAPAAASSTTGKFRSVADRVGARTFADATRRESALDRRSWWVWRGLGWRRLARHGMAWLGTGWRGTAWHGMVWWGVASSYPTGN